MIRTAAVTVLAAPIFALAQALVPTPVAPEATPSALGDGPLERIVRVTTSGVGDVARLEAYGRMMDCCPRPGHVSLLVTPDALDRLEADGWDTLITIHDVGEHLRANQALRDAVRARRGVTFYDDFRTYDEIDQRLDDLVAAHPNLVTRVSAGMSLEGRDLYGLRITGPGDASARPQMAINGTQHAREWVSPMTCVYFAQALLEGYGSDPRITDLLDQLEIHVLPVVNPDGYVFTHASLNNRLWRKNRRQVDAVSIGVDLNRNWGFQWNAGQPGSSSGNPNSDIYRGTSAFSEPESLAVSGYLSSLTRLRGHIDVHSFSQLILGPWGYDDTILPPRLDELRNVQEAMSEAIFEVNGATYVPGLGSDQLLYTADGVMQDWTFGALNVVAWTYELRDTGQNGFVLPPAQIIPTAQEATNGFLTLAEALLTSAGFRLDATPAATAIPEAPVTVPIRVFGTNQISLGGTPMIHTRTLGESTFASAPLTGSEPAFEATIAGLACGQTAEYFFTVESSDGSLSRLPETDGAFFEIEFLPMELSFSDDGETDLGWTVSGDASDGQWERAIPAGGGDRGDPAEDADLSGLGFAFVTDNEDGNSDIDGGATILTSPELDLPDGGTVSFAYWLNQGPGDFADDSLTLEASTDPLGESWTELRRYTQPVFAWTFDSATLPAGDTVRMRFIASDGGQPSLIEAGVDAILVNRVGDCPCPADLDASGTVDIIDLLVFLEGFFADSLPVTELLDFLSLWFPAQGAGDCL